MSNQSVMTAENLRLHELTEQWKVAKQAEADARDRRIAVESSIYELVESDLPEKGTTTLETGMKIVTGFSESWDQERINKAWNMWPEGEPFPFETEWTPKGRDITYVRENRPSLYALLKDALTLKPKKPAFSIKS